MTDVSLTIGAMPLLLGALLLAGFVGWRDVRRGARFGRTTLDVAAIVYFAGVLAVTVFPMVIGRPAFSMAADPGWRDSVNLVPFRTIELYLRSSLTGVARVNLLGNLALLAPMGLMLPLRWRRFGGWWRIALAGVVCATSIELLQFARKYVLGMPGRSVDVDDVILNTLGVLLAFTVFKVAQALGARPADA